MNNTKLPNADGPVEEFVHDLHVVEGWELENCPICKEKELDKNNNKES
jgi:hypothetical protein